MPEFFEILGRASGSLANQAPEFLQTHPVSSKRVAETRARAREYNIDDVSESIGYSLARARARLVTASRNELALEHFRGESTSQNEIDKLEVEYGTALALARLGDYASAESILKNLLAEYEEAIPLYTGLGRIQSLSGNQQAALATYSEAMSLFPRNIPLTVRYAETLLRYSEPERAHEILLDLLNHVPPTLEQVRLIALAANAAGDTADAHYYMAEYHAMSGGLKLAVDQLVLALGIPGLDNVQKARFRARLDEFQDYMQIIESQKRQRSQ
jgi:predicted Zn-dependent protease